MRNKLIAGLATVVAATAIAAPAQAQIVAPAPGPSITSNACKVRSSNDEGQRFTYAECLVSVNNVPAGKKVTVKYRSNLKTFTPRAEFGPWNKRTGKVDAGNGESFGLQMAFPGKSVAQVKKQLKIKLTGTMPGGTVTGTTATP